jgi:dTDP-4-amino-4,6-dideoxygalactose transaminase
MKNKMELKDLGRQYKKYKRRIDKAIKRVLQSTSFISGKEVGLLEHQLAEYVGVEHCITCGNGTDALSLVLMAWGIGPGDAVFVPNFTFFSTAEVVTHIGATPIFIDVHLETYNIDSKSLEMAIKYVLKDTNLIPRVVIPVDLFGLCADYSEINELCKKYNLLILEDAAQGFGANINGKRACSFGDAATTSFYPAKPLGCYGDGGAIFTNDDILANKIKSLRNHGIGEQRYEHIRVGLNSRLDSIQAAVLLIKLRVLEGHELNKINQVAKKYNNKLMNYVNVPNIPDGYYSSYAQYTIRLKSERLRDELAKYLDSKSIPSVVYYPKTMHQQKVYANHLYNLVPLNNSINLTKTVLSIPIHPYLTDTEVDYISNSIVDFFIDVERN